jgi:hypothetical protein
VKELLQEVERNRLLLKYIYEAMGLKHGVSNEEKNIDIINVESLNFKYPYWNKTLELMTSM